jgi:hypothetical protein
MRLQRSAVVFAACFALAACKDKQQDKLQREQHQYNIVQEGSASDVTGTLTAPGEAAPTTDTTTASTGMTATNADTTTAFTLPGAAPGTATSAQPGSLGATLPTDASGNFGSYQQPRRTPPRRAEQPQNDTATAIQHASPAPQPAPPATDTPATSTTSAEGPPQTQTDTAPKKHDEQQPPAPQPPPTDTRG